MKRAVLLVGGFDTSGGAGLAADLRVAAALGWKAHLLLTAIAIQSDQKFYALEDLKGDDILRQLEAIPRHEIAAVKIGALGSGKIWPALMKDFVRFRVPIVLDPVLFTTTLGSLIDINQKKIRTFYVEEMIPYCTVLTPNIPEAAFLLGERIPKMNAAEKFARRLHEKFHCNVLVKGGHTKGGFISDVLCCDRQIFIFCERRLPRRRIRGTGCALASALACRLGRGMPLPTATQKALQDLRSWISTSRRKTGEIYHLLYA